MASRNRPTNLITDYNGDREDAGIPGIWSGNHFKNRLTGRRVRADQGDTIVYPSQRGSGGEANALFNPDLARRPTQGRHLDYYWDGGRVAYVRDAEANQVYEIA